MENKLTQRDYLNGLKDIVNGKETKISTEDFVKFIDSRIALLDKKNASRKTTLTETQKENIDLSAKIYDYLNENGNEKTCSQIAKEFALSTQRTSPILEKLIKEGKLEKNMVKRVNYFKVIA